MSCRIGRKKLFISISLPEHGHKLLSFHVPNLDAMQDTFNQIVLKGIILNSSRLELFVLLEKKTLDITLAELNRGINAIKSNGIRFNKLWYFIYSDLAPLQWSFLNWSSFQLLDISLYHQSMYWELWAINLGEQECCFSYFLPLLLISASQPHPTKLAEHWASGFLEVSNSLPSFINGHMPQEFQWAHATGCPWAPWLLSTGLEVPHTQPCPCGIWV